MKRSSYAIQLRNVTFWQYWLLSTFSIRLYGSSFLFHLDALRKVQINRSCGNSRKKLFIQFLRFQYSFCEIHWNKNPISSSFQQVSTLKTEISLYFSYIRWDVTTSFLIFECNKQCSLLRFDTSGTENQQQCGKYMGESDDRIEHQHWIK